MMNTNHFQNLFCDIKVGCFDAIPVLHELTHVQLMKTFVGSKPEALVVTAPSHCIFSMCTLFDTYIKFSVQLVEDDSVTGVTATGSSTDQQRNAFIILTAAQKQLQL